ncbi:MAG: hypothetical protein KGS00_11190 [Alphaproteobacteria bacterium]|nr:hypothetical protein [Alphaproteobacteria bacterium]
MHQPLKGAPQVLSWSALSRITHIPEARGVMSIISLQTSLRPSFARRSDTRTQEASNNDLCLIMKALLESHREDKPGSTNGTFSPSPDALTSSLEDKCEASGLLDRSGALVSDLLSQLTHIRSHLADRLIEREEEGRHGIMRVEDAPSIGLRILPDFSGAIHSPMIPVEHKTGDKLYDLSLLLISLLESGQRSQANIAMNTYFDAAREPDQDLGVLSFFMAVRSLDRAADACSGGDSRTADKRVQLAKSIMATTSPAVAALCVASPQSSSLLGLRIATELSGPCGARRLNAASILNELRQTIWSGPLASAGQEPAGRATVYRLLAQRALSAVAANCSVVAEAPFLEAPARVLIEAAARGGPFAGVWTGAHRDLTALPSMEAGRPEASVNAHGPASRSVSDAPDGWLSLNHRRDEDVPVSVSAVLRHIGAQRRVWEYGAHSRDLGYRRASSGCATSLSIRP